jgi:hypothetical protein
VTICMMPGCDTSAGCQCERNARALSGCCIQHAPSYEDLAAENKTLKMALHALMRRGVPTPEETKIITDGLAAAVHK